MTSKEYSDIVVAIAFERDTETLKKIVTMARGQMSVVKREQAKEAAFTERVISRFRAAREN
jgi:hypothetical protein